MRFRRRLAVVTTLSFEELRSSWKRQGHRKYTGTTGPKKPPLQKMCGTGNMVPGRAVSSDWVLQGGRTVSFGRQIIWWAEKGDTGWRNTGSQALDIKIVYEPMGSEGVLGLWRNVIGYESRKVSRIGHCNLNKSKSSHEFINSKLFPSNDGTKKEV